MVSNSMAPGSKTPKSRSVASIFYVRLERSQTFDIDVVCAALILNDILSSKERANTAWMGGPVRLWKRTL